MYETIKQSSVYLFLGLLMSYILIWAVMAVLYGIPVPGWIIYVGFAQIAGGVVLVVYNEKELSPTFIAKSRLVALLTGVLGILGLLKLLFGIGRLVYLTVPRTIKFLWKAAAEFYNWVAKEQLD